MPHYNLWNCKHTPISIALFVFRASHINQKKGDGKPKTKIIKTLTRSRYPDTQRHEVISEFFAHHGVSHTRKHSTACQGSLVTERAAVFNADVHFNREAGQLR